MAENYLAYLLFLLIWAVLSLALLPLPHLSKGVYRFVRRHAPRLIAHPRMAGLWKRSRSRMGPIQAYLPTLGIVALGIAITIFVGEDFVELAVLLRQQSPLMLDVDQKIYTWTASMRSRTSTWLFVAFSILGGPAGLVVVALIVAAFLWTGRHKGLALYLIITSAIGAVLNLVMKSLFERERPDLAVALRNAHGYSFPSGHAMGSMIVLGALVYVVSRMRWPWRRRALLIALLISSILTIGVSRVYLGVHWSSDIAAGFAAGLVWLILATVAFDVLWRIRRIRGERRAP